jgi:DNA ligase 1
MEQTILYRKHVNGLGTWRIWNENNVLHFASAQVEDGKEVEHTEVITVNQSGRNLGEQITLQMNSRIKRMLDKGYKEKREDALAGATNTLGLLRPMLAQPIQKVRSINYTGASLQYKLDGHRCLITRDGGDIIAYTRQGKLIPSIKHIVSALDNILPESVTLDGELYHHGTPLQTIGSWIKREQKETEKLTYVVYDLIANDVFVNRLAELMMIFGPHIHENIPINLLPTKAYTDEQNMKELFQLARNNHYEGLILRTNDRGYEAGIRSQSLIKIKQFFDDEFVVVDIHPSKDGWAICTCVAKNNRTFDVSAPGDMGMKKMVMELRDSYIGRMLTVEYSMLTNDGIPFHPTATRWKEEL